MWQKGPEAFTAYGDTLCFVSGVMQMQSQMMALSDGGSSMTKNIKLAEK